MFKKRCNFLFSNEKVEHRCGPSKSIDSVDSIGHTDRSEQPILNDMEKKVPINVDYLFDIRNIWSLISDDTFFVRDSNGDRYSIFFDIENHIFEVDNDSSFMSELEIIVSSYLNRGSKSKKKNHTCNDTESSWKKNIISSIDSYLHFEVSINSSISSSTNNYSESYIYNFICTENKNSSESDRSSIRTSQNIDPFYKFRHLWVQCENCYGSNYKKFFGERMYICEFCGYHLKMSSSDRIELSIDPGTWDPMDKDMASVDPIEFDSPVEFDEEPDSDIDHDFSEEPYSDSYIDHDFPEEAYSDFSEEPYSDSYIDHDFPEEAYSDFPEEPDSDSDRDHIDFPEEAYSDFSEEAYSDFPEEPDSDSDRDHIDFSEEEPDSDSDRDHIDFSEEEPDSDSYIDRIYSYQRKTGLTEAVQTGIGQLNGIPIAIGIMDFHFMGGSMGSVVGEKITRLIEYATNRSLPVIIVCASGGARMQEGSLSLMQMAKISSALYNYQLDKKLFYVAILTDPTTGGVTASFAMLGDIIIAEPNATIAFAGKRVIEQTLNTTVPEGSQTSEYLFEKGLFDLIVPRNLLKGVLSELFQLHGFFPLNHSSKN
uniref:Acetyl-coenzyme A carboxylase carboxyl transferase subunit beta, chloroplastic n=17 Tax=Zingiberaceae TaxID=4642 RepID=A0A6M8B295_ZINZE|nr:acetyl-CoA carboxylase carboxyltransferase beta subunit [Zingiber zerumbet]QKD77342.1 acetyl-CoA carboxylase carboxyltransferase beta subunit [Zingiber zerumbet]